MNITITFIILLLALLFLSLEARCSSCRKRRRRRVREMRAAIALVLQEKHVEQALNADSISILHSDYYYKTKAPFYKPLCTVIENSFSLQTDKPVLERGAKFTQILSQDVKDIISKNVTNWYTVKIYTKENFPNTYRDNNMNITKNFDDVIQYYTEQCYVETTFLFEMCLLLIALLFGMFFLFPFYN